MQPTDAEREIISQQRDKKWLLKWLICEEDDSMAIANSFKVAFSLFQVLTQ